MTISPFFWPRSLPDDAAVGDQGVDDLLPAAAVSAILPPSASISPIGYQLRVHRVGHRHFHQPVAVHIHRDGIAGGQMHRAGLGRDDAVIDDIGARTRPARLVPAVITPLLTIAAWGCPAG